MSEPLFDVFMLAVAGGRLAYRRSRHRYRVGAARRASSAAWPR